MKSSFSFRIVGVFIIVAALAALILFAFPVFISSCDSRFTRADGGGTNVGAHGGGEGADSSVGAHGMRPQEMGDKNTGGEYAGNAAWRGKPFDLSAVKAEIESAEIPDGADEMVWDALGKAFIIELERAQSNRTANAAPKQDAGRVDDFKFDSATGLISWTYKNLGDYDLSGEVGIADITAIALNFGKTIEYDGEGKPTGDIETPEGLENHRLAWIDGDKNGEIGISDVTPIALNYLNDVVEYAVVSADSATAPDGEWIELFRIIMPTDKTFPVRFEQMLPGGARNLVGVRAVGKDGSIGERSNLAAVITTVAPVIYGINLPTGVSGDFVLFSAVVTGTHPRFYEWNFGGGAEPNITNDALPTVTLGSIGWYDGRLTVTNEYGTAIRDFKYYVPGQPLQPPVAIAQAWPLGGDAPLEVTFLSNLSYSPNGAIVKYEWDFETDGTYDWESEVPANAVHTYEGGLWKATLRVTDEAGQVGTAETPLVTTYPAEGWQVTSVSDRTLFPEATSAIFVLFDAFIFPISIPAFVSGAGSSGRKAVFFPSHEHAWQRSNYTENSGSRADSTYVQYAGVKSNGTITIYIGKLALAPAANDPEKLFEEISPMGAVTAVPDPNVPFTSSTVIVKARTAGENGYVAVLRAKSPATGRWPRYLAQFNGAVWTYEEIPLPNPRIYDLIVDGDRIACVSTYGSIWLTEKKEDEWSSRLVGVPPGLTLFDRAKLHVIDGNYAVVASYADGSGVSGGVRFFIERGGIWESEDIVPVGDPAGFSKDISTAANGNFLSVAFWVKQNRVLRVLYYDGAGWSNEALSFSQVEDVDSERYINGISSAISNEGMLHIVFSAETDEEGVYYFYASKQLG